MFLKLTLVSCLAILVNSCPREPSFYHSQVRKVPGDNGFQIKINEAPERYVPGQVYTMYITGSRSFERLQNFRRFTLNVMASSKLKSGSSHRDIDQDASSMSPQRVGSFQLFGDALARFNEDCVNTLSETNDVLKTEVLFMWKAPPPGSGCVTFRAMVLQDSTHWYADDDRLSLEFCERTDKDVKLDPDDCCACDEAKYQVTFEGIWSNATHPKDFPTSLWLTHFSDLIGASHEKNFSFWGVGQIATEGFRSLAEWGSVRLMESELRAKSRYLRSIVKAPGLWYPRVNSNTSAQFRVDRRHNMVSLASMFGPTPDWVVGVDNLNLCKKDCTWMEDLTVDLYPYDAGTDNGITYMSPNAETVPRERMYRITTKYPEDPRAPFYDPRREQNEPLARFYFHREKLIQKSCDEQFLFAQIEESENSDDANKPECAVTDYTAWTECSVSCGKGLSMRTREYRIPAKAAMFNCNRQLVSKEMCVAAVPECDKENEADTSEEEVLEVNDALCMTTPWSEWAECSETCGIGFKSRSRLFKDPNSRKKCTHVELFDREKCMGPPCGPGDSGGLDMPNPMCPTTDWSDWSPCSATCGKGIKMRTRLLLVEPSLQQKCSMQVELIQQRPCVDTDDCTFDMATAKEVCMQPSLQGPCTGLFNRWYFEPAKRMCLPFQYGGCRGNRNNFFTAQECTDVCKVVRDALNGGGVPQTSVETTTSVIFAPPQILYRNINEAATTESYNDEPQDCMVTEWSDLGPCSASCGVGVAERRRMIKRPPANGGRPCPKRLVRRIYCNQRPC